MVRGRSLALVALVACSRAAAETPKDPQPAPAVVTTTSQAEVAMDQPAAPAAPEKRVLAGKTVLHCGDSMVGGPAGLSKALEAKFKPEGVKFYRDWQTSSGIITYDHEPWLKKLLAEYKPDIVILTLGANDVYVPFPDTLATHVASIVKKIGSRECYWMAPALWSKPDTGVLRVIEENAAPCKYFDSANLKIQRAGDGVHPTNKGGEQWAEKFWTFFQANTALN